MKYFFFCLFTLAITASDAQTVCAFSRGDSAIQLCDLIQPSNFKTDVDALQAIQKILSPIGLPQKFSLVQCKNVNNCAAVYKDGVRYILYDNDYLNAIEKSDRSNYVSLSILAHEIAHHVLFHTITRAADPTILRAYELEADEFSGFIMCKLNFTLEQAQQAINDLKDQPDCDAEEWSDHPCREKRLEAIKKGYIKCEGLIGEIKDPTYYTSEEDSVKVPEFGGNQYCTYSCNFSAIKLYVDQKNLKAILKFHYTEKALFDCPYQVAKPQEHLVNSTYCKFDSATKKISIVFASDSIFGLTIGFSGRMLTEQKALLGIVNIERPTLESFRGYYINFPVVIFPNKKIGKETDTQFKTLIGRERTERLNSH